MSVFLMAYTNPYTHMPFLEQNKTVISLANDDDTLDIFYHESMFDEQGNFFYNRVLISSEATNSDGCSLETLLTLE